MTFVEWFESKYREDWILYSQEYGIENGLVNFGIRYRKLIEEYLKFCDDNNYEAFLDG